MVDRFEWGNVEIRQDSSKLEKTNVVYTEMRDSTLNCVGRKTSSRVGMGEEKLDLAFSGLLSLARLQGPRRARRHLPSNWSQCKTSRFALLSASI